MGGHICEGWHIYGGAVKRGIGWGLFKGSEITNWLQFPFVICGNTHRKDQFPAESFFFWCRKFWFVTLALPGEGSRLFGGFFADLFWTNWTKCNLPLCLRCQNITAAGFDGTRIGSFPRLAERTQNDFFSFCYQEKRQVLSRTQKATVANKSGMSQRSKGFPSALRVFHPSERLYIGRKVILIGLEVKHKQRDETRD